MNVEIEAEAALFPEKEYINGIFLAVRRSEGVVGNSAHLKMDTFVDEIWIPTNSNILWVAFVFIYAWLISLKIILPFQICKVTKCIVDCIVNFPLYLKN